MLTKEKLKQMKPGEIIATGIGFYVEIIDMEIRWVAVRGGTYDWCIYYHRAEESIEYIKRSGDKMFTESVIKRLVPCDNKAWDLYRF